MTKLNAGRMKGGVSLLFVIIASTAPAQNFTTLVNLNNTNSGSPQFVVLAQGADGDFYGTGQQSVFKVSPQGTLTTLYVFCSLPGSVDGSYVSAGLVLATDGNFYGTTSMGGTNCLSYGCGTVFKITPAGQLTTLYSFCAQPNCTDGSGPMAALIQDTNQSFYGTTLEGGIYGDCPPGCGTIFRITSRGKFKRLHAFAYPGGGPIAGLVEGTDGNLYGADGGNSDYGSVFGITPSGRYATLHYFHFTDGSFPNGKLIEGPNRNLYGTTGGGGANGNYGTVFKITRHGKVTTLYSFCAQANCQDGAFPWDGLVLGTDGNFYGTTWGGGADFVDCTLYQVGCGTLFQITPKGVLTTLHSFDAIDGAYPFGGLVQSTNGIFYGTTSAGGAHLVPFPSGAGTIFSLDMGLGPFVTFVQAAGKVGQTGGILGQGFTGTTSVSINGIQAHFTVVSDTHIRATVPEGATTGYVKVATPTGVLTSNVPFRVIP